MSRTDHIYKYLAMLLSLTLMAACDTTSNLPEEETLYAGIARLDYDAKPRATQTDKQAGEEGVITALADAYTTVEGLLTGDGSALKAKAEQSEQEAKDSLRRRHKQDDAAYATAREEVEAVLAYAPNGAIMGSTMCMRTWGLLAPSICAASMSSTGML